MKKTLLLMIVCLSLLRTTDGQTNRNCQMLNQIFHNNKVKEQFLLDTYLNKPIIVVDINHFFDGYKISPYKGRVIKYVYDSSCLKEKSIEFVIIHDLLKKNNKYYIVIENKATGSYGDIEFVNSKNAMKISKVELGYF